MKLRANAKGKAAHDVESEWIDLTSVRKERLLALQKWWRMLRLAGKEGLLESWEGRA